MTQRHFVQTCYVVPDLEAAMQRWLDTTGMGPFIVMSHVSPSDGFYRGQPDDLEMSCAFVQAGPMQIEYIQQHSDGPSVYRDMYAPGEGGYHHLCYFVDDLDAEIAYYRERGIDAAYLAKFGDLRYGYFDTRAQLGGFTEVLQREPGVLGLFESIAEAARDWDGSDPVRYLDLG
ncbi:VOC family protein [Mangrovimicrobium sediminis]|uniref:VOC family protein n=1 Tax=Mangrovimicrobium sediminis TaxID=2562682 RepID=A0A4Z0M852_9GAMM|nr:VOC family protein [Haliea sp. SAOS-164]TGD75699.1 VOC family protein [Haliea sp. SAOS-164]